VDVIFVMIGAVGGTLNIAETLADESLAPTALIALILNM
jgi:hypothetical protein